MEKNEWKKNNYGHGINRKYLGIFKEIVVSLDNLLNIDLDRNKMLTLNSHIIYIYTLYISIYIYI